MEEDTRKIIIIQDLALEEIMVAMVIPMVNVMSATVNIMEMLETTMEAVVIDPLIMIAIVAMIKDIVLVDEASMSEEVDQAKLAIEALEGEMFLPVAREAKLMIISHHMLAVMRMPTMAAKVNTSEVGETKGIEKTTE